MPETILVTYHTNYNGADVDGSEDEAKCEKLVDKVVEYAHQFCNSEEGGLFEGDADSLAEFIIVSAKEVFGNDTVVSIDFDDLST